MGLFSTHADDFRKEDKRIHSELKKQEDRITLMINDINSKMEILERIGLPTNNNSHKLKEVEGALYTLLNIFFNLKGSYPRNDIYTDVHDRVNMLLKLSRNHAFGDNNPYNTQLGYLKQKIHEVIPILVKDKKTFENADESLPN